MSSASLVARAKGGPVLLTGGETGTGASSSEGTGSTSSTVVAVAVSGRQVLPLRSNSGTSSKSVAWQGDQQVNSVQEEGNNSLSPVKASEVPCPA